MNAAIVSSWTIFGLKGCQAYKTRNSSVHNYNVE